MIIWALPLKKRPGFLFQTFFAEIAQKGFPRQPLTQFQLTIHHSSFKISKKSGFHFIENRFLIKIVNNFISVLLQFSQGFLCEIPYCPKPLNCPATVHFCWRQPKLR